jgi:hypothetical protein
MNLNKKIFNYIIIKLKNNYKEFDCNDSNKVIYYKAEDTQRYQLYSLDIQHNNINIIVTLLFNNQSNIKSLADNVFYKKYYIFDYKYWLLLKYIKLTFENNNCKIVDRMEKTNDFFNDKELRNLKLKDLKN